MSQETNSSSILSDSLLLLSVLWVQELLSLTYCSKEKGPDCSRPSSRFYARGALPSGGRGIKYLPQLLHETVDELGITSDFLDPEENEGCLREFLTQDLFSSPVERNSKSDDQDTMLVEKTSTLLDALRTELQLHRTHTGTIGVDALAERREQHLGVGNRQNIRAAPANESELRCFK